MNEKTSLSVVIPAYNEEATIRQVVERAIIALNKHFNNYEIIIANDASTDSTPIILDELKQKYCNILRTIHHKKNRGIAHTMNHLYSISRMDYILDISADGQFDTEEIVSKIVPIIEQYDIIVCQRDNKHYGLYRSIVSFCYRYIPKVLFGIDLFDPGCAKCVRKEIRQNNNLISKGVFMEAERCIRAVTYNSSKIGKIDISVSKPQQRKGSGGQIKLVIEATYDLFKLWRIMR